MHYYFAKSRNMKCDSCGFTLDRDVIAVLNLQMRGAGFTPRVLDEPNERKELHVYKRLCSSEPIFVQKCFNLPPPDLEVI
ncbi:MAG: zinc ribbon domain-containing protein [Nitrososphaerota archaeon]|nr:zinc ribbon domain-containing protein [Candidatus Bathyarchaeota archaeon]MDW8194571.1 zinc ribbon domain-containing protein [Nitrososphaerota archaeon]